MKARITKDEFFQSALTIVSIAIACLLIGCGRSRETASGDSSGTNPAVATPAGDDSVKPSNEDRTEEYKALMERAQKAMEERRRNRPKNEMALPNFDAGPGRPYPIERNFYRIDDRYPGYLQCLYTVNENPYDPTKESEWIKAALLQIRETGQHRFPPADWIAVIIKNGAEHKDKNTFEQSHKVGAIFLASEVFDPKHDLRESVAPAKMDRHPFKLDQQQPTPGKQRRWLIVERHAATNETASGSSQP